MVCLVSWGFQSVKAAASKCLNECLRILWLEDVWLSSDVANRAGQLGKYFLRAYVRLGEIAWAHKLPRWPLMPKHHLLYHTFHELTFNASVNEWVLNPIVEATPMDEDFVGKVCRISRRCGTRGITKSCLRRYLIACHDEWQEEC